MSSPDPLLEPRLQTDLLLYRLYRIHTTAARMVVPMCEREFGLTRREWRVLSFLSMHEGALSSELAEHAMLDRARTSRTLTRLVEKRLVERRPRPSDRREVHVHLTDEGRQMYREVFPRMSAINRELVGVLSADERRLLDGMVQRLQAQAERMAGSAAQSDAGSTTEV